MNTLFAQDSDLVFDREDYLRTLPHIGEVMQVEGFAHPLLRRTIPGTGDFDLAGPWPYAGHFPTTDLEALKASGAVSLTSVLRPDAPLEGIAAAGYAHRLLKDHFVIDPTREQNPLSKAARGNLAMAERNWQLETSGQPGEMAATAVRLFADLAQRRVVSGVTAMPARHFEMLFHIPDIVVLTIRGANGLGGMMIAARSSGGIHALHFLADEDARRTNGAYLLMEGARRIWAADQPVYLGGVPSSPGSEGVGKFKQRWANRVAPATLITAILDPDRYAALAATRGTRDYFPAYRSANDA